jgi:PAS domain S-box-containing protein
MFGYTAEEAIGQSIRIIIPEDRQDEETEVLARLRRGEKVDHYETVRRRKDGTSVPISLTVSPVRNDRGIVIGASKIARDISDRKRAEEERERRHRRAVFLSEIAGALSESLAYGETLSRVAALVVPAFADWCAVDVVREDGEVERVAVTHAHGGKVELADEIRRRYEHPRSPNWPLHVIRTATPALFPDLTDEMIVAAAHGDEERIGLVRELGLRSYVCVPLVVAGRALGALTVANGESGRRFDEDDIRLAEDIASRAALAVANARSYEQLQRANRLKDEFLATLSHELRTPLNAILGYARLASGGILTGAKLSRAMEIIERNAAALTQMVEDILDVSRIVAGKMRLDVQPVELPAVLQDAIETIRPAADAKRIKLHAVIDPQVPAISGRLEPALECGEVHAAAGTRAGAPRTNQFECGDHDQRHGRRYRTRVSPPCLRAVPPGRCRQHAPAVRARPRPRHRPQSRRAPRRHRHRLERRTRDRRDLPRPVAGDDRASRGRGGRPRAPAA